MANTYTDQLRLTKQGQGENEATWGILLNTVIDLVEESVSGLASIDLSSSSVTLSTANGGTDQARHAMLKAVGSIGADREIIVPAKTKSYIVWNNTAGSYTVTVKTAAGTGEVVPQGETRVAFCDGTNVYVLGDAGTSAATASTIMARDSAGRSKVASPAAADDIATKSYVDAVIPSGTNMLFFQASVPTGWTQDTSQNDKMIRVVSGTGGGTGGAWAISGVSVNSHILTLAQIPQHAHLILPSGSYVDLNNSAGGYGNGNGGFTGGQNLLVGASTGVSGSSQSHTHGLSVDGTWRPAYIDAVPGTKD